MKSIIKIAGLCLASMLVMSMALASAASAAPLWLVCLPMTGGKFLDSQCLKPGAGNWESVPLSGSDTVRLVGFTLRLTDLKAGLLKEKTTVKCNGKGSEGEGLITSPNIGLINTAEVKNAKENCERVEGGCKAGEVEEVKGADLPWKTEIFETEKKYLTKILADGHGEPGWAVKCNTALGSKTDTCLSENTEKDEQAELISTERSAELIVLSRFEKLHKAKCSEGGPETGEVEGLIGVLLASGNGLSINN
jgi:hypothetical protein